MVDLCDGSTYVHALVGYVHGGDAVGSGEEWWVWGDGAGLFPDWGEWVPPMGGAAAGKGAVFTSAAASLLGGERASQLRADVKGCSDRPINPGPALSGPLYILRRQEARFGPVSRAIGPVKKLT